MIVLREAIGLMITVLITVKLQLNKEFPLNKQQGEGFN